MSEERRDNTDRRKQGDRRSDEDWLFFGPERRKQAKDRRVNEEDRRQEED